VEKLAAPALDQLPDPRRPDRAHYPVDRPQVGERSAVFPS
jgi:hypothetical protein